MCDNDFLVPKILVVTNPSTKNSNCSKQSMLHLGMIFIELILKAGVSNFIYISLDQREGPTLKFGGSLIIKIERGA